VGSVKTQSNDAIYHMLAKILKFSTTKIQCLQDNQEVFFIGCNVGLQVGGRGGQMFWQCEA